MPGLKIRSSLSLTRIPVLVSGECYAALSGSSKERKGRCTHTKSHHYSHPGLLQSFLASADINTQEQRRSGLRFTSTDEGEPEIWKGVGTKYGVKPFLLRQVEIWDVAKGVESLFETARRYFDITWSERY